MKSFFLPAFFLMGVVSTLFILSACHKYPNPSSNTEGRVTAALNGSPDSANQIAAVQVVSSDLFYIAGINMMAGDTTTLSVTFSDSISLNIPVPFDGFFTFMEYTDSKSGTAYSNEGTASNPGTVTLTGWDISTQSITGTFQGTLYNQANPLDSIVVTGGAFKVGYSVE